MRLIDVEKLHMGRCTDYSTVDKENYSNGWNDALNVIESARTIYALPVIHAHWEIIQDKFDNEYQCIKCSNCNNYTRIMIPKHVKFCPNCGANMNYGECN